jgi:hypothetical protein
VKKHDARSMSASSDEGTARARRRAGAGADRHAERHSGLAQRVVRKCRAGCWRKTAHADSAGIRNASRYAELGVLVDRRS